VYPTGLAEQQVDRWSFNATFIETTGSRNDVRQFQASKRWFPWL